MNLIEGRVYHMIGLFVLPLCDNDELLKCLIHIISRDEDSLPAYILKTL